MCERTYPITEDELIAKYNALVLKSQKQAAMIVFLQAGTNDLLRVLENLLLWDNGGDIEPGELPGDLVAEAHAVVNSVRLRT